MKSIKKVIVVFLTMLLVLFGFGGCGTTITEPVTPINVKLDKNTVGKVTISTNSLFMPDLEKLRTGFNKQYPNIKVVIKPQANNNESILQWFNGDKKKPGTSPDIFWFTTGDYMPLANGGILKDMTPYFAEAYKQGTITESDLKKEMFNLGKENFSENGKQYLMPTQYDQFVTIINKTIFEKAHITIGNPGTQTMTFTYTPIGASQPKTIDANKWTWTEFEEIAMLCKQFYMNETQWQAIAPVTTHLESDALITPVLKSHGVEIFGENNNLLAENDADQKAKLVAGLTFMNDMVKKGYTSYVPGGSIDSGKIAMHFQSRPGMILPEKTEGVTFPNPGYFGSEQADVVPFPAINIKGIDTPCVGGGSHGYAMYKFTRNANEAWAFMQYMLSQEGQNILGDSGLQVPLLNSMNENHENEDWNWLKKPNATINHSAFISYPERMKATDFHVGLPTKAQQDALNAYMKMAQNSTKDGKYEDNIAKFISEIKYTLAKA